MKRIHFIAIGGAIMHQLAIALQNKGYTVSGSDDAIADPARSNLARVNLLPEAEGWFPEKLNNTLDAVVLGMHAKEDNPELKAAQALGLTIYSFPEFVYELSKEKKRIVVAGSHGKTTITSMIMHVLQACGKDFDYLVGAKVDGFEQSVKLSDAPIIILEGDEYPASAVEPRPKIFFYHPDISVLSGIAWDHINVFPTFDNYISQFKTYLLNMNKGALLLYNGEDSEVNMVVQSCAGHLNKKAYKTPDFHYEEGVAVIDTPDGPQKVAVFGWHNLSNLEAARGVCNELGISDDSFYESVTGFRGAARRLERLFEKPGIIAFRDFAHAPSKLKATMGAVREALPHHKLVAVFELHTFSSLNKEFLSEYAGSMSEADHAVIFYSQHALQLKGLPDLDPNDIKNQFSDEALNVTDTKDQLIGCVSDIIASIEKPACLLLMSSGTFDGVDWESALNGAF